MGANSWARGRDSKGRGNTSPISHLGHSVSSGAKPTQEQEITQTTTTGLLWGATDKRGKGRAAGHVISASAAATGGGGWQEGSLCRGLMQRGSAGPQSPRLLTSPRQFCSPSQAQPNCRNLKVSPNPPQPPPEPFLSQPCLASAREFSTHHTVWQIPTRPGAWAPQGLLHPRAQHSPCLLHTVWEGALTEISLSQRTEDTQFQGPQIIPQQAALTTHICTLPTTLKEKSSPCSWFSIKPGQSWLPALPSLR